MKHSKIIAALTRMGEEKFIEQAEIQLSENPKCRVVLGLYGGPSTGRYGFSYTAGKNYPRYAVRYERGKGIVGISRHAGPYLYVSI